MLLLNLALDVVGAVVKPRAARKRLERAGEMFGEEGLVELELGPQLLIMPRQIHEMLAGQREVPPGANLLQALRVALQRGEDVQTVTQKKEAA
jgi:hypothetical protein